MKRLVYAPKAFAFIDSDLGLIDVSPDIVSGSVTRRINQVSQAELTLRNKNLKYTEQGNPAFHPMDKITIYLQRMPNTPIQVFTGYLDQAPYSQLYPGNCTMTASCTLKRLLYTYFDPGLQFVGEFLQQYGWLTNYATGQLENVAAAQAAAMPDKNDPGHIDLTDGSIARVTYAVLRDIGKWSEDTIYIEALPKDLPQRVAEIYNHFQKEDEGTQKELQDFFAKLIGTASQASGAGGPASTDGGTPPGNEQELAKTLLSNKSVIWNSFGDPQSPHDTVTSLSRGKCAYVQKTGKCIFVAVNMLRALVDMANHFPIAINSIVESTIHVDNSNHYRGHAVDLDLGPGHAGEIASIAKKYGGSRNSETSHIHLDF